MDGFTPEAQLLDSFKKTIDDLPQNNLFVVITTDKGLCGGGWVGRGGGLRRQAQREPRSRDAEAALARRCVPLPVVQV